MIRSMTGFGRGRVLFRQGTITAEIKTVNHKFFDATLKMPSALASREEDVKEMLQKRIERGKVYCSLVCDGVRLKEERVAFNAKVAAQYCHELTALARQLRLDGGLRMRDIVSLPGVLTYEASEGPLDKAWPAVKRAIERALARLAIERAKEGKALYRDLIKRSKRISAMLAAIRSRAHLTVEEYRKRFIERAKELTGGELNAGRLEMEVAIYAKSCDISEEITRLENHLDNFNKTIAAGSEAGKKLDFIAQELHRETNTIGSKSGDFRISKCVIEIKGEIEKIREQAKNVE